MVWQASPVFSTVDTGATPPTISPAAGVSRQFDELRVTFPPVNPVASMPVQLHPVVKYCVEGLLFGTSSGLETEVRVSEQIPSVVVPPNVAVTAHVAGLVLVILMYPEVVT
jgi:hypothetical protein